MALNLSINAAPPELARLDHAEFLQRVRPPGWKNPRVKKIYDLVVVGAGPAGLAATALATGMGLSVALVERNWLGGDSFNFGSIPSKALIRTARVVATARDADQIGAPATVEPPVDFGAVMARLRRIRTRVAEYHSIDRLQSQGVDVFFGDAQFDDTRAIIINGARLSFRKALVATGARPRSSNIPGLDELEYFTSSTIFDIPALPRRLAIIGGGPLGCELAQAFCRLGVHVAIIQNDPKFLPAEDRDAAQILSLSLSRDGVETRLNTTVVEARLEGGVKDVVLADAIVLSIGRVPNVEGLRLEKARIDSEPDQRIKVDDFLCTSNSDVYAAGDVCMEHKFTNVAEASAAIAIRNAFVSTDRRPSRLLTPWCTFCDPEVAHIGMHISDARRQSIPIKSFTIMMQDVDRAITDGQDDGFVKIHVREGTDTILGATIVAARASEMINELSVIMHAGVGMRDLAGILHTYPTQSDAIRMAATAFVRDQSRASKGNENGGASSALLRSSRRDGLVADRTTYRPDGSAVD
jgi:pyruvate/2-oxoglutarate dehydrogenase complex dihydrolipoamide dehydrogenase (E3) component